MKRELIELAHELAYSAARADIECHCLQASGHRAKRYYDIDTAEAEDADQVARALRYLELRGLIVRAELPNVVLVLPDAPVPAGRFTPTLEDARRIGKIDGYGEAIKALLPMVDRMQTLRTALDEQLGGLIDDLGRWRAKHESR